MDNFSYYAPTEVVFGRDTELSCGEHTAKWGGTKVLLVFGGHSALASGLIGRVEASLSEKNIAVKRFGGVKPNPRLAFAEQGVQEALSFGADFILAVGGGSAIDTAKAIAHGTANPKENLWDIWTGKVPLTKSLPVGAVLTIPAAGSEMSDSAVLTNEAIGKKAGINTVFNRVKFAIMNPKLAFTLPKAQLSYGITDIMMHTLERYFIPNIVSDVTNEFAEGLLRTVIKNGRYLIDNYDKDHEDDEAYYNAYAELMWCSSLSHNGITECGKGKDFSVHKLGHALSAKYDVAHGASLSAVWASWARFQYDAAPEVFARYADKVWRIPAGEYSLSEAALLGIEATEHYFQEIGAPVSLRELGVVATDADMQALALDATMNDTIKLSRLKPLGAKEVYQIYQMADFV